LKAVHTRKGTYVAVSTRWIAEYAVQSIQRAINLLADRGRAISSMLFIASTALGIPTDLTTIAGSVAVALHLVYKLWRGISNLSWKALEAERIKVAKRLKELKAWLEHLKPQGEAQFRRSLQEPRAENCESEKSDQDA